MSDRYASAPDVSVHRLVLCLACAAMVFVAACGEAADSGAPAKGHTLTIGFSPMTMAAPALQGLAHGVTAYGGSKGYAVKVADPNGDPAKQVQQLLGWIWRGEVDVVWTLPVSAGPMRQVLDEARKRKVPILAVGEPKDFGYARPAAGVSFSGIDNTVYGRRLGALMADCVNRRLGGRAKVILVVDPPGTSSAPKTVRDGFVAGLSAGAPGAKIVAEVDSHADRLKAQQATASALQAHPDADALAGFNNESTLGGLGALEQAGRKPASLCVAGSGADDEAKAAVKSGKLYGEIEIEFERDLRESVDLLAKMAADPTAAGINKPTPIAEYRG
ncbi:MAG TPA: sugar ABC transporter substrate-binding protein [Solirubrobacter sp.]